MQAQLHSAQRTALLHTHHDALRSRKSISCQTRRTTTAALDASTTSPAQQTCPFHQVQGALQQVLPSRPSRPDTDTADTPIPGPSPFSIESLMDVSTIFKEGLHVAMLRFSEKYGPICSCGEVQIMAFRFANPALLNGASSWVFLNLPDHVQHVCATNVKNYTRRYLPDIYKFVTHEKGILGSQDDYNTRHRRLCAPPFRNKLQLQKFASVISARSQKLVNIWKQHGTFETDIATQTQRLTLDIVGLTAFSHDFQQVEQIQRDLNGLGNDTSQRTDRMLWAVNTFGEVLAKVFITPLPLLQIFDKLGFSELRDLSKAVHTMRESMLDVIQARRLAHAAAGSNACQEDLLDALLQAVDEEGRPMNDEELWEDVHDIMGAGHETTATTTAAVLYCISAHPEVEAAVAAELQQVLGDREPTYEDLEQLQYLSQCVKETMRLYPAIPVFPREAQSDDVLSTGHCIAAGDVVFMSSYALGRSAAIWEDPLEFRPERFSPAQEAQQHRFQFLPFGAGPRMCLGPSFAQMSVTLMCACLLQNFQFQPVHPNSRLIPTGYDITMNFNPTHGLKMQVSPR